jgi:hypothetical protein
VARTASAAPPRAISALAEPRPSPPAPVEGPPLKPTPAVVERREPRSSPAPKPSQPAETAESLSKAAAAIVANVGWTRAEAVRLEPIADALQSLDHALSDQDLAHAKAAVERLRAAVEAGADPSGLLLKERLGLLSARLTSYKDRLARTDLRLLEDRYFELAQRPRERLPLAEYRARLRDQEELGREIDRLARVR